jgi:hypothetical protein
MKKWLLFLLSMLCADAALAEPPAPPPTGAQEAASELVKQRLLQPLTKAESKRKRFSRAAPVAKQRRVRVLDLAAQTDVRGKQFVRFAVDQRYGWDEDEEWELDAFVGCAYPDQKQVFLRRGDDYVPARSALGGDDEAQPDVCRAASPNGVRVASAAP